MYISRLLKKAGIRNKWLRWFVTVIVLLLLLWGMMFLLIPKRLFSTPYSSLVYSADNELLGARIAKDGQWRFPPIDSLPNKFITCLTTYEDKRFFKHIGIDPLALARAIRLNISRGDVVSGGSTITMQLARVARGNQSRNIWQKGIEMAWALHLETTYTKQEILAMYASHAPFGGNIIGVETAAWRYFGRGLDNLSWAENALLAVLPNSPALIHPGRNRDALKTKRDKLLERLSELDIISHMDYELGCMEPLPEAPKPLPDFAPHLTERIVATFPGSKTKSTIAVNMQKRCQEIVDNYAKQFASNHIYNISAIIADVESGEVVAYVGNVSHKGKSDSGYSVDIITSSRSTGSILKPLLYAGMLHDGMILPSTLVSDIPLNINGFMPQNFNKTFHGSVPAKRAIERSLNVPLVRMLSTYNTGRFMELLKRYGMTTLNFNEEHYGASIILGGAEGTLWDMAGIYASMARVLNNYSRYSGRYNPADIHPLTLNKLPEQDPILSIEDSRLTNKSTLSAASLWHSMEAMSGLNRPEEEADWEQFRSMKRIAWKTGTSYGSRDAWSIGVTPRYVVGVWVGNASGEGRAGLTGVGYAAPVMFDLFSMLSNTQWFDLPYDEMTKMAICRQSGHKASDICYPIDSVYIPTSGIATDTCPYHRIIHLSKDERWQVNSSCENIDNIVSKPWFVLPPAQEYYYRNHNANYQPLPPFKSGCSQPLAKSIEIIYPDHNSVLHLPKGFSGEREKFIFKAAHADYNATIYWYIDKDYIGMTVENHQIAFEAEVGKHLLTLTDEKGNVRKINFTVK